MKNPFVHKAALAALVLAFQSSAFAVTVPAGVTLAASQEMTRQVPTET
jgi:oligopeptide transport system substrate-binding protein